MEKRFTPLFYEINSDTTNKQFKGKYIVFINVGTWSVRVSGLLLLPLEQHRHDLQGHEGEIVIEPEIRFEHDLTNDPSVVGDLRLKTGKRLRVETLKLVDSEE